MSFIDWSDSEGMFGLLIEYVADEKKDCRSDDGRQRFLADLMKKLIALQQQSDVLSGVEFIQQLRTIQKSVDREFGNDAAMLHLNDCIEELERVERHHPTHTDEGQV